MLMCTMDIRTVCNGSRAVPTMWLLVRRACGAQRAAIGIVCVVYIVSVVFDETFNSSLLLGSTRVEYLNFLRTVICLLCLLMQATLSKERASRMLDFFNTFPPTQPGRGSKIFEAWTRLLDSPSDTHEVEHFWVFWTARTVKDAPDAWWPYV